MSFGACMKRSAQSWSERDRKRKLQHRLDELGLKFGGSPADLPQRRPYPKATPKFRNPNGSSETWSGRGKQPRWIIELLAPDGKSTIQDLSDSIRIIPVHITQPINVCEADRTAASVGRLQ
jgi:hypothetical protein